MSGCGRLHLVHAHYDGELAEAERGEFDAHLASCAACRAELEGLREVAGAVRGLALPAVDAAFLDRLGTIPDRDRSTWRTAAALVAAAGVLLAVGAAWLAIAGEEGGRVSDWELMASARATEPGAADASDVQLAAWVVRDLSGGRKGR